MKRVLVASRSSVMRGGLEAVINSSPALALIGSSPGVATATFAQQVDELQPDVALVVLEAHDEEALSELLALGTRSHDLAIVVLSDDAQGLWATEALRSGVRAILPRDSTTEEIEVAVEAAAAGLVILHPAIFESLSANIAITARNLPVTQMEALTPREVEVLGMMAEGLGNKSIASRLGISEHTVKFHVSSIFAKLGASSRTQAVTVGIRQGLIML